MPYMGLDFTLVYALKQHPIRAYTVLMILICKRKKNTASINVSYVGTKPFNTSLDVRNSDFVSCEQQRHRPACASAHSGQRLCYSLSGK